MRAFQTGSALLLDGHDAALVRAAVVDAHGHVVWGASHNVSFAVVSGPGVVLGTHNGDTRCHEPNGVPWRSAYHGLVRAVVRVAAATARPDAERKLMAFVDRKGAADLASPATSIVVQASAPGVAPATISVPTSLDASHGVMAVARASAGIAVPLSR